MPIPKTCTRPIAAEELVLDVYGEIADPTGDPQEILVRGHGAVDQHHRRRRVAVLVDQPPPEIEQYDANPLISASTRDQKISTSAYRIARTSPQIIPQSPSDSSKTKTIACFSIKRGALFERIKGHGRFARVW
jgi:hypothetical protein